MGPYILHTVQSTVDTTVRLIDIAVVKYRIRSYVILRSASSVSFRKDDPLGCHQTEDDYALKRKAMLVFERAPLYVPIGTITASSILQSCWETPGPVSSDPEA